jgi:uncharacterized protein with beta-barrel porin domain
MASNTLNKHDIKTALKTSKNNKWLSYFSGLSIILGSTFGAINSAQAGNGDAVAISNGQTANSQTGSIAQSDFTLQTDEATATTFIIDAIIDFAVDLIATENSATVASTINVVNGTFTVDETITMLAQTTGSTTYTMKVADGAAVIHSGAMVLAGANSIFDIELAGSTYTLNEASSQAYAAAIDSDAGADGALVLLNAGAKTFARSVGGTNGLATIQVGSATDDAGASFASTVKATTITVTSGEATGENSTAAFAGVVTGNLVLTDGAHASSHALASFTNSTAAVAISGTITTTKTDADDTFITVLDSAAGAAAAQTFSGQIGTTTNKIGTITVGATNGNAGIAIFSEDVFAANLKIIADNGTTEHSTVTLSKAFSGTAITLDDDTGLATLIVAGTDTTITGTLNGTGADGEGTLQITGAGTTMASNIGSTGSRSLLAIDVNATTTFDGTTEATTMTVDADTTFTGAATANTGTTIATSGTDVTYSAASSVGTTTLASGTSLTANAILTSGDLTVTSGTLNLNVASNVVDHLLLAGTGELHVPKTMASGANLNTSSTIDGAGSFVSTAKIFLPANLNSGDTLTLTDSGGFDAAGGGQTEDTTATAIDLILQDTALTDYSAAATSGTVITITATDKTNSAIGSELGITANDANSAIQAMAALAASNAASLDTAGYDAFENAMHARSGLSAIEDTALMKQVAPQTEIISGSTVAAQAITGSVQGIMSNRMASLRSGDAYFGTGMSAGGSMSAKSGFVQVFGTSAEQKSKTVGQGTQAGFDSESTGVALGFDGISDDGLTVGLSMSMSETDVDGKGAGKSRNTMDTYTASLYMDKATDTGYIEGSLTYGISENGVSRQITAAGLGRTLTGSYDSEQVSLNIGGGVPTEVANGYITPFVNFTGTVIDTDAYTEKSTVVDDALRLKIAQDDVSSMVGTLGVKYHNVMDNGGTPMISLAINNEFGDSLIKSVNTFQGGGTHFTTTTDVEELSATLGLGYSYGSDAAAIEVSYEADVNDDEYISHYGTIKIVGKF